MAANGITMVMQYVADVEKSIAWYEDLLGTKVERGELPALSWGDGAIVTFAPSEAGTGRGGTSVWFSVDDVVAAYAELKGRGYAFNEEPMERPDGGGGFVTLNDLDGNIVGLVSG